MRVSSAVRGTRGRRAGRRASRGSPARRRWRPRRSGSTSAAAAGPTCSTRSGRRATGAARARLELLHVGVELDEARLLDDADVARDVAAHAVPRGPPPEPAAVAAEMVQRGAHLPEIDQVEGEVVEVRRALVDQRHHVMVRVDVEPDAPVAEPVRHAHAEHVRVERDVLTERAREEVDVAELARMVARQVGRRPRVRRPAGRGLAVGHELDHVAVGVRDEEGAVTILVRRAGRVEVRSRGVERARAAQLEARVVVPRAVALDQLERVRLVVARQQRAAAVAPAVREPELDRPAPRRLLEVGDAQGDVVDAADGDHAPSPPPRAARPRPPGWRGRRAACSATPAAGRRAPRGRRPTPPPCWRGARSRRSPPRRRRRPPSGASSRACRSAPRRPARA